MEDSNLYNLPRQEKSCAEIHPFLNITDCVEKKRKTEPGKDHACIFLGTINQLGNKSGESKNFLLSGACRMVCLFSILSNLCSSSVQLGCSPSTTVTGLYQSSLQLGLDF